MIRIFRRGSFLAFLSRFGVFVDGHKIGAIKNGGEETFNLGPGKHTVFIKGAAWSKSQNIEVNVSAGDLRTFECGVRARFFLPVILGWIGELSLPAILHAIGAISYSASLLLRLILILALFVISIVLLVRTFKSGAVYYLKES